MTPERYKIASARFGLYASKLGLHGGSPLSLARFEGSRDGYLRGFGDGVEHILETSSSLQALETTIKLKDIRLEILDKDNKHLKMRLDHRVRLHSDAVVELKTIIDRLTLLIGLRDPGLLKSMQEIRERLEVSQNKNIDEINRV
jgi:hypothetical protein